MGFRIGRDTAGPAEVVLRDLGHLPLADLEPAEASPSTVGDAAAKVWQQSGRSSVAWINKVDGLTYLLTGPATADVRRIAEDLAGQVGRPSTLSAPGVMRIGDADATSYWALLSPIENPPPKGSIRYAWTDPSDPRRGLWITISPGGASEAATLAGLMGPVSSTLLSDTPDPAYLGCADETCSSGLASWSAGADTVGLQWSGMAPGEITTTIQEGK